MKASLNCASLSSHSREYLVVLECAAKTSVSNMFGLIIGKQIIARCGVSTALTIASKFQSNAAVFCNITARFSVRSQEWH